MCHDYRLSLKFTLSKFLYVRKNRCPKKTLYKVSWLFSWGPFEVFRPLQNRCYKLARNLIDMQHNKIRTWCQCEVGFSRHVYGVFYLRAVASPVNSLQIWAIPRNCAKLKNSCSQFHKVARNSAKYRAIARNGIAIGNPSFKFDIN